MMESERESDRMKERGRERGVHKEGEGRKREMTQDSFHPSDVKGRRIGAGQLPLLSKSILFIAVMGGISRPSSTTERPLAAQSRQAANHKAPKSTC